VCTSVDIRACVDIRTCVPIVLTYDAESASIDPNDRTRLSLVFRRLGWEHIGGSAFRYPALDSGPHPSEDWFNHVIPALMFFRALIEKRDVTLKRFTIEAHSSAGSGASGAELCEAGSIPYYDPTADDTKTGTTVAESTAKLLSEATLRAWISAVSDAVPGG
jgi:hypothetical protein